MTSVDPVYDQSATAILAQVADHLAYARDWLAAHSASIDHHPVVDPGGAIYPRLDEVRRALDRDDGGDEFRAIDKSWIIGGCQTLVCHPPH